MDESVLHKLLGLSTSMVEWYLLWQVGFAATVFESLVELNRILLTVLKLREFSQADEAQWLCIIAKG